MLVLSPVSGEVFSEFTCSGGIAQMTIKGSVAGALSPLGVKGKTVNVAFKQTSLIQQPSEYETESGSKVASRLSCTESGVAKKCAYETITPTSLTFTGEEATIEA